MLTSSQAREFSASLALLAFHEGIVDSSQLRRCVRYWVEDPDTDFSCVLADEFGVDSSTIAQLGERLSVIHGEHEPGGPHLDFENESQDIESLKNAPASTSKLIAGEPTTNSASSTEQRGDDELAKKSKRGKSKGSGRADSFDYYDSVHERFTRDDRLIPYLVQTALAYRRKLAMDLRRSWRSFKSLLANTNDWFKSNWRNALIATVAILIFVPACIFASSLLRPNRTKDRTISSTGEQSAGGQGTQVDDSVESNSLGAESDAGLDREHDLSRGDDTIVAGDRGEKPIAVEEAADAEVGPDERVAAIDRALATGGRAPESALGSPGDLLGTTDSSLPSVARRDAESVEGDNVLSSQSPDPVDELASQRNEAPAIESDEQRVQQALQRGSELLKRRQFARASVILKSARLDLPESSELAYMLIVAQLASKSYSEAGSLLVDERIANAEDPVWQMLFATWLLEAPEQSRVSVRGELLSLASGRAQSDILHRCIAWIDAREGKGKEAVAVLAIQPIFGERSFADALFYCASLSSVAKKEEARIQLQYAKNKFAEREKELRRETSPDSPAYYAVIMSSPKIASTINRFAAKLR